VIRWNLPLFEGLRPLSRGRSVRDALAGVNLACINVAQVLGYARIAGMPVVTGLYTLLLPPVAFALLGSSRHLVVAADSATAAILASSLSLIAAPSSAHYVALVEALALLTAVMLLLARLFKLGFLADFLSRTVLSGFLAGVGAQVAIAMLGDMLGVAETSRNSLIRVWQVLGGLPAASTATLALSAAVIAAILLGKRFVPRWPVPLAAIIGMVVMVQTAATTQAFPSEPDRPPDVDRDFIGVGAGSVLAGLAGTFPVNASPPRTATVAQTGGRSQLAGIVAVAIVVALMVAGTALLRNVPLAALGGVLFFVAYRIVRVRQIAAVYQASFGEFMLIVATMAAIVVLPIEQGVGVGIALSLLHGIWTTTQARLVIFERVPGTTIWWPRSARTKGETEPGVVVAGMQAPLSFLNANAFRADARAALQSAPEPPRLFVLEATGIVEIDYTAAQALIGFIRECHERGVLFAIARLESERAQDALTRFHVHEVLDPDRIFHSVEEAIRTLDPTDGSG